MNEIDIAAILELIQRAYQLTLGTIETAIHLRRLVKEPKEDRETLGK